MAKTRMFVSVSLFLVVMTLTMIGSHVSAKAMTRTPAAIFILGDSTVDIGTNNFIPESGARADMPHNGVDYHGSPPTGRFSNSYNTADSIVQLMDFKESPPSFLYVLYKHKQHLRSIQNFKGLNFASGGSGLLDNTGKVPYE
ncbi:GDSL esterase/lipase At5g55050-like [Corylus avellana]|uniref:GDSL esterase/lipase At5g55050-like n=1 Tax=Corylus avellana TaxID=13451 RepID=UPI00286B6E29|nr:GDSL esterase/lipase At5g55050-like [Corylus avellana]